MCTKDKRSTYIPIIPHKDFIQWQGQATHGLLHDSVEEMSERWVLRNSRSFTFYENPTPTSHGNPWCDAIPCSPHLMGPDLELEPLGCPGPSRQVLPAKWCQWCHATKGMGIFIAFIPMECWKPSRLPASVAIPPPALQKWAPPPQSAAKSLRCILPQRLAKINIKQSFQFRCKNGLNNWLVQSLSHYCIYCITFYFKTTTRDQPKWAQSFGNEIESQGSQVSAFQP